MRRKPLGRDFGLSARMAVAGVVLAIVYVAALLAPLWLASHGLLELRYALLLIGFVALLLALQYLSLDALALRAAGAQLVGRDEAPELHAVLERLAGLADVPKPRAAVIPSDVPNAFAAGRNPQRSTIAITLGLARELEPGEVEAVLAHELSHVVNRDGAVMTFASFPALTLREALASARLRYWILLFPLMLLGSLFYGLSLALMLTISRCREYSADRGAALITGAPEQLMSALQKIAGSVARIPNADLRSVATMSAFFIVPTRLRAHTHPPLEKRLQRLAEIARELGRPEPEISVPDAAVDPRRNLVEGVVAFVLVFAVVLVAGTQLLR